MNSKFRRRCFGAICLLIAIAILVAGETVLKGRITGATFIGYWLSCFVLTALATGAALIDVSRVRAEQRDEQRALIESTLKEVERESRMRKDAGKR